MNKEGKISLVNNNVVIVVPNAILKVHGDHVHQVADLDVKSSDIVFVTAYYGV